MITVVGSFNMDLFIEAPRFPAPGETLFGKNFRRAPGGKGANQAYAIACMGQPAAMIGALGKDAFGEEMAASLNSVGVHTSGVVWRNDVASGVGMVTLDSTGQNQIIVANGANDTLAADDVRKHSALIKKSRALVTQLETPLESVETALSLAREAGIPAILNPAPHSEIPDLVLALCDWIIPNEIEASRLGGIEVCDSQTAAKAAARIRKRSNCPNILITLGANGAWLDKPHLSLHIPAFTVDAIDTVGAGDTFIGAWVTKLVEGADIREAVRYGCAAAGIAVTRRGAQSSIPTRAEVEDFLKRRG